MTHKFERQQGNVVINRDADGYDKYLEQRRAIRARREESDENKTIIELLRKIQNDVDAIKKQLAET